MATIEKPKTKKKKSVKKSELLKVSDTNVPSSSSCITNTIQDYIIETQLTASLTEDDKTDYESLTDEVLVEDKNTGSSTGNVEVAVASFSSNEFVDIVSEYSNNLKQVTICDDEIKRTEELQDEVFLTENRIEIPAEIEEVVQIEIPSAPEESLPTTIISYPKLSALDDLENELSAPVEIESTVPLIKCKPFTCDQLRELYSNPEIPMSESFEKEFINVELLSNHRDHVLYDLLMKYSKSRYNLMINHIDLQNIKKSIPEDASKFWTIESRNIRYSGKCMDGTLVSGTEHFNYAVLDEPFVDKVQSLLADSTNLICTSSFSMYNSEIWRLEIEQKIDELITARPEFTNFASNEPVKLNFNVKDDLFDAIREIRLSISILFCFTRRPQPDKTFANEIKIWLTKLVAVLLRLATWQDHLFLLYHVLRCPAGVASWASSYIQIPKPSADMNRSIFNNDEVHHCMALIRTLLLPIKTRNEFLAQLKDDSKVLDGGKDDLWVLVDSDGDEDHTPTGDCIGLKENDLISFLNQLPFEELFAQMTFANKRYDKFTIAENSVTGHHLLQFIAFSTNLVQLLGEGMKTYDTERFKQFAKILSLLVRHTVLYVSNLNQIFKNNSASKDPQLCLRIQIEYDTFVLRAIQHIYKSRSLGAWQYLAILPFSDVCSQTIWKLYYALIVGFSEDVIENVDDDFRRKVVEADRSKAFNDSLIDVPSDDMYYLLQTFSSMALSRELKDWDFVVRVSMDIFQIGFVNTATKELCYKISRDLIVNITTLHPYLISSLLAEIRDNYETVDNAVYLFKSLPLDKWKPTLIDFEYTASLILNNNFDSSKSLLARTIFSRLNWGFDDSQQLFLPHDIHIRIACLIAEVASKHVPEVVGSSGISESVRSVSNLVKGQTTRQQFSTWCWNMISLLRLHCMDQSNDIIIQTLHNPADIMKYIPELERIQAIHQGVNDSRPIALYLSLLCSVWGHSVPQICHKGFIQMQSLLSDYRHSIVIRCIQLIVPLFLECPESLSNCDKFQSILSQLLAADKTYMKMAKDLITTDYVGPVVELLGNMIQYQIINYVNYGLRSPVLLVNLWLQCLTNNSNWFKDVNAIHIIDLILKIAYQFQDAWYSAKEFFRFMHMNSDDTNVNKQSSFLTFLISSPNGPFPAPSPNALWLAMLTLEVEHEVLEIQTKLWPELMRQLQLITDKFSMDVVIKKSANIVGCQSCASSSLTIYKLANLIITCSHSHPLLPVICQKFFYLYHSRVPLNRDEQQITDQYGISQKFYEQNIGLMKKLKSFLIETENYYTGTALKSDDDALSQFYGAVAKLFKSFTLWLEETRISRVNKVTEFEFPPQFNPNKLAAIFSRNETYWTEYVYLPNVRKQQKDAANTWLKSCFRFHSEKIVRSASKIIESTDPKEIIIRHLQSYGKPQLPPNIPEATNIIEKITYKELLKELIAPNFRRAFKNVVDYSRQFNMTIQEMNALNCTYKELIRLLYENTPINTTRTVVCRASNGCSGSGSVHIKISNTSINEPVRIKIMNNRDRCDKLIDVQISKIPQDFTKSIVQIRHSIRSLLAMYQTSKYTKQQHQIDIIKNTGLVLFYEIVNGINESINLCQPSHELCAHALSTLGVLIVEDQNREGLRLLKTAVNRSDLINMFSDLIVPSVTEPQYFLEMYKFIVDSYMRKCDTKILFVLLSKFDIFNWLIQFKPKLYDITELLKLIIKGLECWNQSDSTLIQGLLRRHLMHIFQYDFPEHYGEVLQVVLLGSSEQKLMPSILFDVVNALYHLSSCKPLESNNSPSNRDDIHHFASTQKLFSYKELLDTMLLLSRHFQNERLQHGLHGLYPKHKDYCDNILLLLKTMGHSVIIAAVHAYPGVLGDTLVDWLWPCLCDTFSPWLVPYYPQNMVNSPANWIKQVMPNNQILLPWSELYVDSAQKMVHAFVDCVQLILDMLPASDTILGHIFYWYEIHYGNPAVPKHILSAIHSSLALLPWNRFKPTPVHIRCLVNVVQQFVPECHSFIGHIFLRITWTPWLQFHINQWDSVTRQTVLSSLLLCLIKLSYEPHVRDSMQLVPLLHESVKYPWHLLDFQGCERVFEWFITSTEPSVILRLPCDYSSVDAEVLNLLQYSADMLPQSEATSSQRHSLVKRTLYVKAVVRMLRLCGSKYQQLLSTKEGLSSYHSAVTDLLNLIENVCQGSSENDTVSLVTEIVSSLQSHGEFTSKIFAEAMIIWQSKSQIGSKVLSCTINAIGSCKVFTNSIFTLLEATLYNYFRTLDSTRHFHKPTWKNVMSRLNQSLPSSTEGKELIQKELFLCLHVYSIYKLNLLKDYGDKITYLQTMHRHLENYKIIEQNEAKVAMIWGLIVACGYELLNVNDNSKSQLLTLGRYLQTISNQSDGWGDGLLGAIGLKKDGFTKKRRILTKCLSCVVFSLFPEIRDDSQLPCKEFVNALEELISTINSKKFSDIRSDGLVAVDIIDNQSKGLAQTKENVCLLIRLFYKEHYLHSIEDAWNFI